MLSIRSMLVIFNQLHLIENYFWVDWEVYSTNCFLPDQILRNLAVEDADGSTRQTEGMTDRPEQVHRDN